MTQHVRTGYRRHRKATWGVALAVLLIGLAVVPFATGAPSKYYTLGVSPTNTCSTPATQTFTLTLTNRTRSQNLGSANITAPSYVQLVQGTQQMVSNTTYSTFTVNVADGFSSTGNTIRLRGLVLPTDGSAATFTVQANVGVGPQAGGSSEWVTTVKQSNTFSDSGPGNLFDRLPNSPVPSTTVSQCHYAFVQGPTSALRDAAQTVKVQLQTSGGAKVNGSGNLALTAYQGVDSNAQLASGVFTGLTSTAANGEWTFNNVVGTVTGQDYSLKADSTRSSYFAIADCIPDATNGTCDVPFRGNGDGTGGAAFSGTGLTGSGIVLSFGSDADPAGICSSVWGWQRLTYPLPGGGTGTFDGIALGSFGYNRSNGFMKVTTYLRNDLFVQTSANQTNDIQVCAGGRHANGGNATAQGSTSRAFKGRDGRLAQWDTTTGLYWGVLQRTPNCNKAPSHIDTGETILDPALCAWGTQTIDGVDYRTATVLVPVDWDWKSGH